MTYRFGIFEFDDSTSTLTRPDRAVALEPQPARALALLLERAGDIVTRDELRAHLWGDDTHVDFDRGLAYGIGQLRAALGDSADNPRFIQTHPRRGFSFIAPIDSGHGQRSAGLSGRSASLSGRSAGLSGRSASLSGRSASLSGRSAGLSGRSASLSGRSASLSGEREPARSAESLALHRTGLGALALATAAVTLLVIAAAGWWTVAHSRAPERPIVAVAMFANETGDASHEPVVAALSDVIVERLTALGPARIGVNGNSSVLRRPRADRDPKTVARDTHASFLVSGALTRKDGRLSLLVQLIKLDDGTHVWVQRVSRPPDDRLETLDDDVAAQIEKAVRRIVLRDGVQVS